MIINAKENENITITNEAKQFNYNLYGELSERIKKYEENVDFSKDNIEYDMLKEEKRQLVDDIKSLKMYSKDELVMLGFDSELATRIKTEEFTDDLLYAASPSIQTTVNAPTKSYSSSTNKTTFTVTCGFRYNNYITGSTFSKHNFGISTFCYTANGSTPTPNSPTSYSGSVRYYYTDSNGVLQNMNKTISTSNKSCGAGCSRYSFTSAIDTTGSLGHVDYGTFTMTFSVTGNIKKLYVNPAYGYTTTGANTFNIANGILSGAYSIFSNDYLSAILAFASIGGSSTQVFGNSMVEYNL